MKRAAEIAELRARELLTGKKGSRFGIKASYLHRERAVYFEDDDESVVYQPDVYMLAAHLGRLAGARYLVDIGCGAGRKLIETAEATGMVPIGIDCGSNLERSRAARPHWQWLEVDLEQPAGSLLPEEVLRQAVLVCADVIEHLNDPTGLVGLLREWMRAARVGVLTTPERDLEYGIGHRGPPPNLRHVREWNAAELASYLRLEGLNVPFIGLTRSNDQSPQMKTTLAILGPTSPSYDT
ncbi:methyltransferase domain-containing protein [Ramlibacter sp. PS4R-6]|uniref:methyltransferase domain-containing protein n=1 Tax=Ramlibacter sp. PS4R-6 TaxID=3133438 RepID=UPI003098AAAE